MNLSLMDSFIIKQGITQKAKLIFFDSINDKKNQIDSAEFEIFKGNKKKSF